MPRTAELLLRKVESLSALMKNAETNLPADVVQAIFRSLYLGTEEKKAILNYLGADVGVTILVIRLYINNRFCEYKTMSNALGPPLKTKDQKMPACPALKLLLVLLLQETAKEPGDLVGKVDAVDQANEVGKLKPRVRLTMTMKNMRMNMTMKNMMKNMGMKRLMENMTMKTSTRLNIIRQLRQSKQDIKIIKLRGLLTAPILK